ncbi:MAG: hypothetical protein K2P94_06375 [Rhodospirillaceae bacterium]|nr:hypothetical protein [Rhodospirillaceae bacterium]
MSQLSSRLKIAIFAGVVAAPLLALAVLGAVAPYGQRPHPAFPKARALAIAKQGAFDQLGKALLDRSIVTREAIRLKYALDYDVSRYVDTDLVVSGRGDWLYYKDDFSKMMVCIGDARIQQALAQVDVMTDLAAAAGLKMFVSISPDKSTVYPEYLHPLARRYWACKTESAAALRRFMAAEAPRIIDHAAPLLAEKARTQGTNLFWHQDTHWTPLGAGLARRQLFEAVLGPRATPVPPPRLTGEMVKRETDMGNLMLLLPDNEMYEQIDSAVETQVGQIYAATPAPGTVLLADSFYTVTAFNDPQVFPGLQERHIDAPDAGDVVAKADRVIINSVERSFLGRVEGGIFHWSSSFGQALLARNAAAGQACDDFRSVAGVEQREGRKVFAVPPPPEGHLPCVRIVLDTTGSTLEIALPRRDGQAGPVFREGRAFTRALPAGKQVWVMVMPAYVGGNVLGLRQLAGAPIGLPGLEIGSMPAP